MMLAKLLLLLTSVNGECRPCEYSEAGIALTQHFEGYSPFIYEDVAGKRTIGFGHLLKPGEHFDEPLLPDEATELLTQDVAFAVRGVNQCIRVRLKQGQFDSLVDFSFNVGVGALQSSKLLKRVNAGRHGEVPAQFMRWVYAGGKKYRGLERRREAEVEFYLVD